MVHATEPIPVMVNSNAKVALKNLNSGLEKCKLMKILKGYFRSRQQRLPTSRELKSGCGIVELKKTWAHDQPHSRHENIDATLFQQ